jgi:hypothetical protein
MTCLLCLLPAVGHDQMWCLYVAQRMTDGVRLYGPQLLESNPPLVMWMLLGPASVARLLPVPISVVFKLCVLALGAASALSCRALLRRLQPHISRTELWACTFAFIAICGAMPARDFGQREHLLVLLTLPYLLAAALAAAPADSRTRISARAAISIGIAAGLGLSLKPHHLLVPLAIEAALALHRRSLRTLLRPEPLALLITCLAYLTAIRLFTPEYLTTILPILRDTYWAIGDLTLKQLLAESIELHILAIIAIALWLTLRLTHPRRPAHRLATIFLIAGAASTLAYYLQGTGWYYQQIPALSFFAFALCAQLIELAQTRLERTPPQPSLEGAWLYGLRKIPFCLRARIHPCRNGHKINRASAPGVNVTKGHRLSPQPVQPRHEKPERRGASAPGTRFPTAAATLSLLAITLTAHFSGYTLAHPLTFPSGLSTTPDPSLFAGLPPGTPVAILTTVVDDSVPPIFTHDLLWAQRQNNLWTLPAILRNESPVQHPPRHLIPPARLAQLDQMQHAWMVEDLQRWRPQLILIARCQDPTIRCQIIEDRHDDLLAWFARDPAFRAEFAHYRYLRSAGPYDAYVLK